MIYLYDMLCYIDLVWLAKPIMYLDCHVTVQAPQPFISEAEVRTLCLLFTTSTGLTTYLAYPDCTCP